jgi:hypothetical protein
MRYTVQRNMRNSIEACNETSPTFGKVFGTLVLGDSEGERGDVAVQKVGDKTLKSQNFEKQNLEFLSWNNSYNTGFF